MFNPQPNVYLKKSEEMRLGLHHVASQFFQVLRRDSSGQHRYTSYVYIFERALRWRENATIYKEQMQTKYSDIIKRCHMISSSEYQSPYENCSTCTFIKGPILICFTTMNERSAFGTSFCTYYFFWKLLQYTYMPSFFKKLFQ